MHIDEDGTIFIERQILGHLLQNQNGLPLGPEAFFDTKHKFIAEAILEAKPHDLITVVQFLTTKNTLQNAGGAGYVAGLLDEFIPSNQESVSAAYRQLRGLAAKREMARQTRVASDCIDAGDDPEAVLTALNKKTAEIVESRQDRRLIHSTNSAFSLITSPPDRPDFLLSNIMPQGSLNLISGIPGARKSYFAFQLACALTSGQDFFGMRTHTANVLYIGPELPDFTASDRLQAIKEIYQIDESRFHLLTYPMPYHMDIMKPQHRHDIMQLCTETEADVLFLDPIARLHNMDENKAQDMISFLGAIDEIRLPLNIATVLVHHESSKTNTTKGRADVDAARGSSILSSHPTLVARLTVKVEKYIQFRVAKSTFGSPPDPFWMEHAPCGCLQVSDGPKKRDEEKADNLAAIINSATDKRIHLDDAVACLPHSRSPQVTRRLLREAGFQSVKGSKTWILLTEEDELPKMDLS